MFGSRSRDRFPYAQLAASRAQRNAVLLWSRKPRLFDADPPQNSSIVLATSALTDRLVEIHRRPDDLRLLDRRAFEELVAELFSGFGYEVELTAKTKDQGRDVIAIKKIDEVAVKYLVECKRPEPGNAVGVGVVRQLFGVVEDERATKGILVATTHFSPDAKSFVLRNKWRLELKEYEQIVEWITSYLLLKGR